MREDRRPTDKKTGTEKPAEAVSRRVSARDGVRYGRTHSDLRNDRKKAAVQDRNGRQDNRPDYSVYQLTQKDWCSCICEYCLLDGCISYLFFYSWIPFVLFLPGIVLWMKEKERNLQKKREKEIRIQFLSGIQMMSASLAAGYSAENALGEAVRELSKIYEADSIMVREFQRIDAQISMNRNLEELLLDFGRRSAVDDIRSFAEVFMTARRSGGDLMMIIRNTVSCIRQKQETMQEIETCLSGKVMEQKIMSMIPLLILTYVKVTSPEFLETVYGNAAGAAVMSVCLVVYAAAYVWGKRMIRIEV